jgi:hypothetical protein
MRMMRGDKAHDNCGKVIPGTDVSHFFDLSPKVGQRGHYYVGVSVLKNTNGSPGWIRMAAGALQQALQCLLPSYD